MANTTLAQQRRTRFINAIARGRAHTASGRGILDSTIRNDLMLQGEYSAIRTHLQFADDALLQMVKDLEAGKYDLPEINHETAETSEEQS